MTRIRKKTTYTIIIVDIRPNLVLLIFLCGVLWRNLSVRRHKPVTWSSSRAIVMSDFPFQGADLGELSIEKQEVSIDRARVFRN